MTAAYPTTHDEEWRFTSVAPIARVDWQPAPAPEAPELPSFYAAGEETRIYVVNGRPLAGAGEKSAPELGSVVDNSQHFFADRNAASHEAPLVIRIPAGQVAGQPIHVIYLALPGSEPAAIYPRTLIVVGAGAQVCIAETYLGPGGGNYFTNAVTEIVAGDGSVVDHYKVQQEAGEAFHIANLAARLGRDASFTSHSISLGGALVRNDVTAILATGSEATLNGLYLAGGTQHVDNHTAIDHAEPHGTSRELYKGILDGRATAVFSGRILVRKDAQKTDARQTNKNLVLSDDAVIDTKPELQIFADDVRCTHGATVGQLDREALFYLQSRGIGQRQARTLLTRAFAQDIIGRVRIEPLRERLEAILLEKLNGHFE